MDSQKHFDVLVVGGGHGGVEAAAAAARLGAHTGLVTLDPQAIGRMSCNPAIGGIGKGQLVREIDALGGWMGLLADAAGIQFRLLNTSKGRAVQSPRAQCSRPAYEHAAQKMVREQQNLHVIAGEAVDFLWRSATRSGPTRQLAGLKLADGTELRGTAVILTTGTFLEGVLHTGLVRKPGGRMGENGAKRMGDALRDLGLPTGRLKTGTPPRIAAESVDYDQLREQPGDAVPTPFSFLHSSVDRQQICCWLTRTTQATHEIVRKHLHEAPMYAGRLEGSGPRYCPSLEDKVVRFADRDGHTVFLEPEGHDSPILYANGISTSLPAEVQKQFVRTIPGMQKARILQPGYAVEYTYVRPGCLRRTLEVREIPGLYLAGQICGTSGYEEAAAQGLVAGLNAALKLAGQEDFVLARHQAYVGVLVDDLVVSDPNEPYRMFTSRAEHRLLLRHDNADQRLTPLGASIGSVCTERVNLLQTKQKRLQQARTYLKEHRDPQSSPAGGPQRNLLDVLRSPQQGYATLKNQVPGIFELGLTEDEWRTLEADLQYSGYVQRQSAWIERASHREQTLLPEDFDFGSISGLRNEAKETLRKLRPETLGSASRLAGVSPADVALLEVVLAKRERQSRTPAESAG